MRQMAHEKLLEFYDQALMAPEMLCLNCANTVWNRAACRCSPSRKNDCILFAGDMVNMLTRHNLEKGRGAESVMEAGF